MNRKRRFEILAIGALPLLLFSFQNCGPGEKVDRAAHYTRASGVAPGSSAPNPALNFAQPIANSKLAGCSSPQVVQVPNATADMPVNAYVLARGVDGNVNCPLVNGPYLEPFRLAQGTGGAPAGSVYSLGGAVFGDLMGAYNFSGTTLYIFGVGGGGVLYYRTIASDWLDLGTTTLISMFPNRLCDPQAGRCPNSGFSVVNTLAGKNEIHIVASSGGPVLMRTLTQPWVPFGGGSTSVPIFKYSKRIAQDVLQTLSGETCYQHLLMKDASGNNVPSGTWVASCDE